MKQRAPASSFEASPPDNDNTLDALDATVIAGLRSMVSEKRPDFLKSVATRYLDEGRHAVEEMRMALSDADSLRAAAHKLKGSSRLVGALKLADLCDELEHIADKEGTLGVQLVDRIEREFTRVCSALERAVA